MSIRNAECSVNYTPAATVRCILAFVLSVLMVLSLCACGRSKPAEAPFEVTVAGANLPEFGDYTGLTEFLNAAENDPVIRIAYMPGTMGSTDELYVTDTEAVSKIINALKKVRISAATKSTVTDWYPSVRLETENGAALSFSFDGEWLAGSKTNYVLSGMDAVWKLIKANAFEPEPLQFGDFCYELLEDGNAEIVEYVGEGGTVAVPDSFDGIPVTSIGYNAFSGRDDVSEIIIPSTVNKIRRKAFAYCDGLERLELNCDELAIGGNAFEYCDSLSEIVIAGGSVYIEIGAFHYCYALSRVELSGSITIEKAAFEYCRALREVDLTGTQSAEIRKGAFNYCENASFTVSAGSDAEAFCKEYQLPYTVA